MKHTLLVCLALALLFTVLPAPAPVVMAQPKGEPKPLVAVMPFKVNSPNVKTADVEANLRDSFELQLAKSGKVRVLSRKQLQQRMKANNFKELEDILNIVKAQEIGKALGVKYLVTGSVLYDETGQVGNVTGVGDNQKRIYTMTMKASLISTSTGEIVWANQATVEAALLPNDWVAIKAALNGLAHKLAKEVTGFLEYIDLQLK